MEAAWHFYELVPGQKIREAVQEEFFSADVIHGAADALIREGIQNSLDAAAGGQSVRVSITIGECKWRTVVPFLEGGLEHFAVLESGIKSPPIPHAPCRYMAFEDFGTTGLTGDPKQYLPLPNIENRFFHFFRVEGRSDKQEDARGRWGVGKQVFPKASKIKSVFASTVRSDDGTHLLMAQAILRAHFVGTQCYQDGWFGLPDREQAPGVLPVADGKTQAEFRRAFQLERESEPGLSLVIPFLHEEITQTEIVAAVLRGYFFPILSGELEVAVKTDQQVVRLTSSTIEGEIEKLEASIRDEMQPLIKIAAWARDNRGAIPVLPAPSADGALQWSEEIVPEEIRKGVRENLQTKSIFGLRIPLMVKPRAPGKPQRPSHFDIFLMRDDKDTGRPLYLREGIIIADMRGPRARGVRSLVIVHSGPLAALLGDSENPSHTQWQKDGSNFKDKYFYGPSYIKFVVDSVAEIIRISTQADDEEDKSLLADIFSTPSIDDEEDDTDTVEDVNKPGKKQVVPPPQVPTGSRTRFVVQRVEGGFTVKPASELPSIPAKVRIRAAYDVRRGNAFSKYDPADFALGELDVKVDGARIMSSQENELVLEADTQEFYATVRGFDPNRDLRVGVNLIREEIR